MLEGQLRASEARESRYLAMLEKAVIDTQPKVGGVLALACC